MYLWGTSRGASDTPPSCHHLSPLQDCPGSLRIVLLVLQHRTTTYKIITLQSCLSCYSMLVLLVLQYCITSLSSAPGKFWLMFNTQQQFLWIKRGEKIMLGPSLESTSFPEFHRRSLFSSPKSSRNCTWRWAATCQIGVNTWRRESSFAFFCTEHNSTISSHTDCSSNSTNGNLAFIRGNWLKGGAVSE